MNPTPKQFQILKTLEAFRRQHGYSPTMQELADQLGISKVTVFERVEALVRKGLILRLPKQARSLELSPLVNRAALELPGPGEAPAPSAAPAAGAPAPGGGVCYPLLGRIAAGRPIEAIESPETLDLGALFETRHGTFVLRVQGESMIEDHIADGDYVIIEKRTQARDGEIVVALLDEGQATLKRYFREKGRIRLQPANAAMEPIFVDGDLQIQGVLIGVLRTFH